MTTTISLHTNDIIIFINMMDGTTVSHLRRNEMLKRSYHEYTAENMINEIRRYSNRRRFFRLRHVRSDQKYQIIMDQ